MAARTLPTLPSFASLSVATSAELNAICAYQAFWANPPMFRMYQATVQSVANVTLAQITCDTPEYDSDTGRASGTPWSYVIPTGFTGRWTFTVCTAWAANATGIRAAALFQNGSQAEGGYIAVPASPAGFATSTSLTLTIPVSAGDVMAAYGEQSSGGALSTFFASNVASTFEGRMASLASP